VTAGRGPGPDRGPDPGTVSDPGLPSRAYVPGRTQRHPEGAFDTLRATACPGMTEDQLAASPALAAGLRYLHAGFHWEAHEVLEPVWLACPPNSAARRMVQALIQIANARLKDRMDRPAAAARLRGLAAAQLAEARQTRAGPILGLDPAQVADWIAAGTN